MYTKFDESMIGKRVRDIESGNIGVLRARWKNTDSGYIHWIEGVNANRLTFKFFQHLLFESSDGVFEESYQEITINGKRYKLVPIE